MAQMMVAFPLYRQVSTGFFSRWVHMRKDYMRQLIECINEITDATDVLEPYILQMIASLPEEARAALITLQKIQPPPPPPVYGVVTVDGAYITTSMNIIVERALAHEGWDRLLIYEQDMLPPVEAIERMTAYGPEHAIVGSVYFKHEPPYTAIVYVEQEDGSFNPLTPQTINDWCADPALYRCDGVGFGFTSIARHVLEDWPKDVPMFELDPAFGSHDLRFCKRAAEQGHKIYVDTSIVCQHLSETAIGLSHNQSQNLPDDVQILDFDYSGS